MENVECGRAISTSLWKQELTAILMSVREGGDSRVCSSTELSQQTSLSLAEDVLNTEL